MENGLHPMKPGGLTLIGRSCRHISEMAEERYSHFLHHFCSWGIRLFYGPWPEGSKRFPGVVLHDCAIQRRPRCLWERQAASTISISYPRTTNATPPIAEVWRLLSSATNFCSGSIEVHADGAKRTFHECAE